MCSHYFPHVIVSVPSSYLLCRSVLSQPTSYRPRLLLEGRPGSGQSSHLAPAVLHALEKFTVYTLDMAVLFGASATAPEETCAQVNQMPLCQMRRLTQKNSYGSFLLSQPCQIQCVLYSGLHWPKRLPQRLQFMGPTSLYSGRWG